MKFKIKILWVIVVVTAMVVVNNWYRFSTALTSIVTNNIYEQLSDVLEHCSTAIDIYFAEQLKIIGFTC
ncbi:MAG: hypothetical protein ACRCW1_06815, partial [Anaerotignaceae bacterium]